MSELVKIPIASAEYQARFDRPYVGLIANDRPRVLEAIMVTLAPFNLRLSNTEIVTTGTLADYKVLLRIPERGISFQFGAEEYKFGTEASSFVRSAGDAKVLVAAERALLDSSGGKVESCMVTTAMHLQPLAKTREEILAPFVPQPLKHIMTKRPAQTFGNHLKWDDGDLLIDFSLAVANGIFLRLRSQFKGHPQLHDILTKVRNDEEMLFEILGVEEAVNA